MKRVREVLDRISGLGPRLLRDWMTSSILVVQAQEIEGGAEKRFKVLYLQPMEEKSYFLGVRVFQDEPSKRGPSRRLFSTATRQRPTSRRATGSKKSRFSVRNHINPRRSMMGAISRTRSLGTRLDKVRIVEVGVVFGLRRHDYVKERYLRYRRYRRMRACNLKRPCRMEHWILRLAVVKNC